MAFEFHTVPMEIQAAALIAAATIVAMSDAGESRTARAMGQAEPTHVAKVAKEILEAYWTPPSR